MKLLFRPGILAALVTILAYYDPVALHGDFVYDDKGSIQQNVVVKGEVPFMREVWLRDFWGTPLSSPTSHKSFRPITTLTLKWNWIIHADKTDDGASTFGFRVTNVALHAAVVWLVTEASAFVFSGNTTGDFIAQLTAGLLFGLHPVHAEAVSNITNRSEMLMSSF